MNFSPSQSLLIIFPLSLSLPSPTTHPSSPSPPPHLPSRPTFPLQLARCPQGGARCGYNRFIPSTQHHRRRTDQCPLPLWRMTPLNLYEGRATLCGDVTKFPRFILTISHLFCWEHSGLLWQILSRKLEFHPSPPPSVVTQAPVHLHGNRSNVQAPQQCPHWRGKEGGRE